LNINNNIEEEEDDLVISDALAEAPDWDFHWLTKGLAVGASFPCDEASRLASEHGVSAVIDLRAEDCDDEEQLREAGIDFLHLPTPDQLSPNAAVLDRGVEFARTHIDRGDRVLIHCQGGIGRSALLALCVLVDLGYEPLDALAHAKNCRWAVSPSYDQYCGWARWLDTRGKQAPDYHSFGCIAYRHLAND
jgi:protein-tyrosine phosphatase